MAGTTVENERKPTEDNSILQHQSSHVPNSISHSQLPREWGNIVDPASTSLHPSGLVFIPSHQALGTLFSTSSIPFSQVPVGSWDTFTHESYLTGGFDEDDSVDRSLLLQTMPDMSAVYSPTPAIAQEDPPSATSPLSRHSLSRHHPSPSPAPSAPIDTQTANLPTTILQVPQEGNIAIPDSHPYSTPSAHETYGATLQTKSNSSQGPRKNKKNFFTKIMMRNIKNKIAKSRDRGKRQSAQNPPAAVKLADPTSTQETRPMSPQQTSPIKVQQHRPTASNASQPKDNLPEETPPAAVPDRTETEPQEPHRHTTAVTSPLRLRIIMEHATATSGNSTMPKSYGAITDSSQQKKDRNDATRENAGEAAIVSQQLPTVDSIRPHLGRSLDTPANTTRSPIDPFCVPIESCKPPGEGRGNGAEQCQPVETGPIAVIDSNVSLLERGHSVDNPRSTPQGLHLARNKGLLPTSDLQSNAPISKPHILQPPPHVEYCEVQSSESTSIKSWVLKSIKVLARPRLLLGLRRIEWTCVSFCNLCSF